MTDKDDFVVGRCFQMCPQKEIEMRKRERLIHNLETFHGKFIKCFKRSAAGIDTSNPEMIRPPHILQETITYMFNTILLDESKPFVVIYHFIEDRLRAIRQDLFIQQPPPEQCFPILQPIIRFYAYSTYRLCECSLKEFDPVLNHNQMLESFKWLLKLYDSYNQVSEDRIEMEALYVLFNLGDPSALHRTINLPKEIRTNYLLIRAEKMSLAWLMGNYIKVCKELYNLPILHAVLTYAVQFPYIKRYGIRVMCTAYSNRNFTVPLSVIQGQLLFDNKEELSALLISHGLEVVYEKEMSVRFSKANWKPIEKTPASTRIKKLDDLLEKHYLPELLLTAHRIS